MWFWRSQVKNESDGAKIKDYCALLPFVIKTKQSKKPSKPQNKELQQIPNFICDNYRMVVLKYFYQIISF